MFDGKLGVNFETNFIPAVFIKSNVTVLSGNVTINNPYRIDNVDIKTDGVLK